MPESRSVGTEWQKAAHGSGTLAHSYTRWARSKTQNIFIILGIIIRDWKGRVLLSGVKSLVGDYSPEIAETMAALFGLHVTFDTGFNFVYLEIDADSVVKLVHGSSVPLCEIGFLIQKICSFLQDQSVIFSFLHIRRTANRMTHHLAKLTTSVEHQIVWMGDYPPYGGSLLVFDSSPSM
ncbi:hypothetical protein ACOSQ2_002961 [Xanthoceras sorbifolium]